MPDKFISLTKVQKAWAISNKLLTCELNDINFSKQSAIKGDEMRFYKEYNWLIIVKIQSRVYQSANQFYNIINWKVKQIWEVAKANLDSIPTKYFLGTKSSFIFKLMNPEWSKCCRRWGALIFLLIIFMCKRNLRKAICVMGSLLCCNMELCNWWYEGSNKLGKQFL